ncbi:MAG: HAD-IIB family hydrolase [Betaproteobacteria bacterium]|nr:HAD-IIB family hydrolase [Betaproteobacteria bacterium]
MRTLDELDPAGIRGLFFDIDDTLTTEGRLTAQAYSALERWKAAGKIAVPITGRPAGWCDHIARMWPVDAVIGENGAFYFYYDPAARKLQKHFLYDEPTRMANRARMAAVRDHILASVPGCALASDQLYREADLAIDFCEDVPALGLAGAERIAALMREAGMTAKISSIHVNGWFGDYDKLGMTRTFARERLGIELEPSGEGFAFAGDSPNDAPMFGFFRNSVGVANVRRYEALLAAKPAFITHGEAGTGFAELVTRLLEG